MTEDPVRRGFADLAYARELLEHTRREMVDDLGRLVDSWQSEETAASKQAYEQVLATWGSALRAMDDHLRSLDNRRSAKGFPPV